jgi:uncharacterized protein YjbI with pentapeptide repeats
MAEKIDPFDVKALEGSLNDSATRVSTIWISFLVFGLYLVIAAGTATQGQLFLDEPLKLPILNIDLPMVGFFFLAPILFVIFHVYVLLQVQLLSRTAAAYNKAVEYNIKLAADNALVRQRLANTLFAQIFAGSPRERKGWLGLLLHMVALLTLAIAPVLVLLVFQFQFLSYHSYLVTWTLRILIVLDLVAVLLLWPALRDPDRHVSLRVILRRWIALPFAIGLVALSWIFLTFPGERHAGWTRWPGDGEKPSEAIAIACWTVSPIAKVTTRLNFDRLILPQASVIDHEKLKNIEANTKSDGLRDSQGERTKRLRGRNLDCANFSDFSDLRRVDLKNASLRGASFFEARLQGASLDSAQLQGASLAAAHLEGASLNGAHLEGASLEAAQLQDASLRGAHLEGAILRGAQLQRAELGGAHLEGASLEAAQLQGAALYDAYLQGADLVDAQLQGAYISSTQLQGANLQGAQLPGATLRDAHLQGADLHYAQLQGADLRGAQLQGADLNDAELQGALLDGAQLQGADLYTNPRVRHGNLEHANIARASVWRARNAICRGARVAEISYEPGLGDITDFIDDSLKDVPSKSKQFAVERMRTGLMVDPAHDDTAAIAKVWAQCADASKLVSKADFEKQHVLFLRDVFCEATENRGVIAAGIFRNWVGISSEISAQLASALLGKDGRPCAASEDIDKAMKEDLRSYLPLPEKGTSSPTTTTQGPN